MRSKTALFALIMALGTAGLAVWMLFAASDSSPDGSAEGPRGSAASKLAPAKPIDPAAQSGWRVGTIYSHAVDLRMSFSGGSQSSGDGRLAVSGTWSTRVLRATAAGRELEVTFQPASEPTAASQAEGYQLPADLRDQLRQRFVVRHDPSGKATELLFSEPPPALAMGLLRELATTYQFSVPSTALSQWTATEMDAGGEVEVAYQSLGGDRYQRRKSRYARVASSEGLVGTDRPGAIVPRIVEADATYQLDDAGRIEEIEARSTVAASHPSLGGELRTVVQTSFRLLSRGQAAVAVGAEPKLRELPLAPGAETFSEIKQEALQNVVKGASFGQLLGDLKASRRAGKHEDVAEAQHRLSALMRLDERAVDKVSEEIRRGGADPALLGALGAAGTPAAQSALLSAANRPGAELPDRLAAVHAMHAVQQPTAESISGMEALASDTTPEMKKDASFALGSMIGKLSAKDPASAKSKLARLAAEYDQARTPEDRSRVLDSLGNTGSPEALPTIKKGIGDSDPAVRITAIRALREIASPEADQLLSTLLGPPADPQTREAALFAAGFRRFGPLAAAFSAGLRSEKDRELRGKMLEALMTYLERDGAKDTLPLIEWVAQNDTDAQLRESAQKALAARKRS